MSVFDEAKRFVSACDIAELNGFHPNRNMYICCPFHTEKTASLKLYPNGSWHCFGCGRGGSSIDFAMALYNLSPLDAVRRLNEDFRLGLPLDRPQGKAERATAQRRREVLNIRKLFEQWRDDTIKELNAAFRVAYLLQKDFPGFDKLTDSEALALQWQSTIEFWGDCLMSEDLAQQMAIFRDRKEVETLCSKILSRMPMILSRMPMKPSAA